MGVAGEENEALTRSRPDPGDPLNEWRNSSENEMLLPSEPANGANPLNELSALAEARQTTGDRSHALIFGRRRTALLSRVAF